MDKKDNPMSRLMELAAPYKGEYVLSVILAILGVAAGLLPFFAVSKIVILLMDGETSVSVYMEWCLIAGIGFLGKVCFANFSTLVSHTATFATLAEIRLKLADKLTRVPMGYMINSESLYSDLYSDLPTVFGLENGAGCIDYPADWYVVL